MTLKAILQSANNNGKKNNPVTSMKSLCVSVYAIYFLPKLILHINPFTLVFCQHKYCALAL